jgi:serine/threonine protein kinase
MFLMEFAPGGDLRHQIDRKNGIGDDDSIRFYAANILLAIKHMHEVRDISVRPLANFVTPPRPHSAKSHTGT